MSEPNWKPGIGTKGVLRRVQEQWTHDIDDTEWLDVEWVEIDELEELGSFVYRHALLEYVRAEADKWEVVSMSEALLAYASGRVIRHHGSRLWLANGTHMSDDGAFAACHLRWDCHAKYEVLQ